MITEYHRIDYEHIYADIYVWLMNTFGPAGIRWFIKGNSLYIRDDIDYTWFTLNWP